ncbi:MAG TPA: DUF4157 domain-containing protein, partial [Methanosarcina sp.]|nr:DUF4157 domain-containing protein [Methanosarcina sp.]
MERQLVTKPGTPEAKTNDYRPSSLSYEPHFQVRGFLHSRKNLSNKPKLSPTKLQTKLEVSQPEDSYEQETDQVDEQVIRIPEPSVSSIEFSKISVFPDQVQRKCSNFCAPHTGFNSPGLHSERILQSQITADNKAVQRLIKSGALQAKLRIGQPNDIYEQEADRVAEQIIKMPKPIIQKQTNFEEEKEESFKTKLSVNHITPLVQRQVEDENEEKPIKRKEAGQNFEVSSDIHTMINSLQGGGQPLPDQVRSYFEPRFGQDFGHVRVHTDSNAVLAARAINAKAFTIGNDVVFGAGQYAPNEVEGRRLLGHELTHVIQQGGTRNSISSKEESNKKLSWGERQKKWLSEKAEKAKELLFETALSAAGVPKEQMMGLIKKAGSAIREIYENPGRFLSTLIKAVGQGFTQFKDRIGEHLKAGFVGWLFGTMSKTGIVLPKDFSPESILSLVLQVLGITASFIRQKFVKIVGEKNVQRFEKAWQVLSTLMNEGIGGLWKMLKEHLGNLKEMVIDQIRNWVITEIIKSAVMKVVSMFNPVSGLITIIKTIYNVIKFLIERARQIKDLFAVIVESVVELAMGSISNAANKIEQALARLIPIAIGFLASLLGIGGITDKIKEIIKRVSSTVDKAIDKVVEKAVKPFVKKLKGFLEKGKEKVIGAGKAVAQVGLPKDPKERVRLAAKAAVSAAKRLTGRVTPALLNPVLSVIKVRYGLTAIKPYKKDGTWWVKATINPEVDQDLGVPSEGANKELEEYVVGCHPAGPPKGSESAEPPKGESHHVPQKVLLKWIGEIYIIAGKATFNSALTEKGEKCIKDAERGDNLSAIWISEKSHKIIHKPSDKEPEELEKVRKEILVATKKGKLSAKAYASTVTRSVYGRIFNVDSGKVKDKDKMNTEVYKRIQYADLKY